MNNKQNFNKKHGLVGICTKFLVICIVLILLVILFLDKVFMNMYQSSVVSFNSFIRDNKQYLVNEDYDKIPLDKYKNISFIIFDDQNNEKFTNNDKLKENLLLNTNKISDKYSKINYQIEKGDNGSYFVLCNKELKDGDDEIIEYGVIDKNKNVVKGELFNNNEKLNDEEFHFIKKLYNNDNRIERYNYKTNNNEKRKLFFLLRLDNNDFKKEYIRIEIIRFIMIITSVIIMIIIFSNIFKNKLIGYIKPLNNLISNYKKDGIVNKENSEVSEYQEIIDNFNELIIKLEQSNEEKRKLYEEGKRIITDISHDIKTPLTVILGYSKALNDNIIPEDKKEYYLNAIYNRAMYANDMIHEFINYSKMEHPDFELHLEKVNINEYIRQYIINIYDEFTSNGYIVDIDIDDSENYAMIDIKLFNRVLVNLTNNFSKYNEPGTTIYFKVFTNDDTIHIYIGDNGEGIDDDIKNKIFAPFITSNEARSSDEGHGLGLSIVKKIIDKHQGSIDLISDSKWTTLFEIKLKRIKD